MDQNIVSRNLSNRLIQIGKPTNVPNGCYTKTIVEINSLIFGFFIFALCLVAPFLLFISVYERHEIKKIWPQLSLRNRRIADENFFNDIGCFLPLSIPILYFILLFVMGMFTNNESASTKYVAKQHEDMLHMQHKESVEIPAKIFRIGEWGTCQSETIGIGVISVYRWETTTWEDPYQFDRPESGYVNIVVDAEAINNSNTNIIHVSSSYFHIVDDKGKEYDTERWVHYPQPSFYPCDLRPNERIRGWLCFEVPANSSHIYLLYEDYPDIYIKFLLW